MSSSQSPLPVEYPVLQVPTIDYTSKDYTGFVQSMLGFAATAFPQWQPYSEGDMGLMLVELMAYLGDILSYYGDRITQEAYLPTATQRLSILNIAQLLGYRPGNGTPSSGYVTFQTDATGPPIEVPMTTQLTSEFSTDQDAPIIFETQQDVVVPGNGGTATVEVVQGITQTMVQLGQSDGSANQALTIPDLGVIDGTVVVYVETDTGAEQWNEVQLLVEADASDQSFATTTDAYGVTTVLFGDGVNGLIPPNQMLIWATYRIGVGAAGNLPAGSVYAFVDPIAGVDVQLLAGADTYNSTAMTGGSDPESNEQIRANAPAAFRTQYRAISPQDYVDMALAVPGVLMATAIATNSTSVTLYVIGPNYTLPGPAMVDAVLTYFDDKTAAGVTLSVASPSVILVDIGTTDSEVVLVVKDKYYREQVQNNVIAAIQAFINPPNVTFGQLLTVGELYETIMNVDGVAYAVIPVITREDVTKTDASSIQFAPTEVPQLGVINMTVAGGIV